MKKTIILLLSTAMLFSACSKKVEKLENEADSLSYALGLDLGNNFLTKYLDNNPSGPKYDAILEGIEKGEEIADSVFIFYDLGLEIATEITNFKEKGISIDLDVEKTKEALFSKINKDSSNVWLSDETAQNVLMTTIQNIQDTTKTNQTYSDAQIDSISYAFGVNYGSAISEGYLNNETKGEKHDAFVDGFEKAISFCDSTLNYYRLGLQAIGNIKNFGEKKEDKLNVEVAKYALELALNGKTDDALMTLEQAKEIINTIFQQREKEYIEETFGENKAAGEMFIQQMKQTEGVQTTTSGLAYKVIKEGNGAKPTSSDKVKVHYTGKFIDGSVFDSSKLRDEAAIFPVNGVIKGFSEGLQLMNVGSSYELYIPYELAYGEAGAGQHIPPFSALIFEVELIEIVK
jgi:FKBP-type peptidyl-prolyl cis-trans isomerase